MFSRPIKKLHVNLLYLLTQQKKCPQVRTVLRPRIATVFVKATWFGSQLVDHLVPKCNTFYVVYLKPLHSSPLSILASSIDLYFPFSSCALGLSIPSIISSLCPARRFAFSLRRRIRKSKEDNQPMAIYAIVIPWPSLYHGLSRALYYSKRHQFIMLLTIK